MNIPSACRESSRGESEAEAQAQAVERRGRTERSGEERSAPGERYAARGVEINRHGGGNGGRIFTLTGHQKKKKKKS